MLMGRPPAPPLDQLAQGLLELDAVAWAIRRAGTELPPRLGWRAEELARRVLEAQRELFPFEEKK
jgi:hypothetical protein